MKVNVAAVSSVHCARQYSPVEVLNLLGGANQFVGKQVVSDIPNTTLVSDFITALVIQLGLSDTKTCLPYAIEKGDVVLDNTKTLEQNGVVENDNVKLRVSIELS